MAEATTHDGETIQVEVHGSGPTVLLPVDPQPVEGERAEEMRKWGMDPALGRTFIEGLSDAFQVVVFDYQGHVMNHPKPGTLTPDNVARDLLAVADAAGPSGSPTTGTRGWRSAGSSSPSAPTASPRWSWAGSRRTRGRTRRCSR
ncbi:alpha/beta fold hydrolase [Nonomuraea salmonea]|uniref:alpha/beta fold hydrolase n=1 Tax=Nonomuraea salmonea TaxID=46181 RepID=UPI003614B448